MKIIGHRGARGLAPENTIASVQKALEYGVQEIEIDVRVTKDQRVVLVHDRFAEHNGRKLLVSAHTYKELCELKPDLTLLDEAIRSIDHRVPLMIEVKPHVPIEPVVAVMQDLIDAGWQASEFSFGSFSQTTLRALHKAMPAISNVVIERLSGTYGIFRARQLGAHRISINHIFLRKSFLKRAIKQNYEVCVYTLNDPGKAATLAQYGLTGVITDRPDLYTS